MTILIVINKPMFIGVTPHVRLASSQQRLNAKKVQLIPVTVEKAHFKDVHQGQIYDVVQRDETITADGTVSLRWAGHRLNARFRECA